MCIISCSEITKCFENQKVALIGDSRMRSLYFQIANSISKEPVPTGYVSLLLIRCDQLLKSYENYISLFRFLIVFHIQQLLGNFFLSISFLLQ